MANPARSDARPEDTRPEFRYVGQRLPRVDGRAKVTGSARYGADDPIPGVVYARLVTSIHARAIIRSIERQGALSVPGVIGVFTADDLPFAAAGCGLRKRDPLARGMALYHGHPIAVVVAESDAIAEDAAQLVEIEYEPIAPTLDPYVAMRDDAPRVRDTDVRLNDDEAQQHGAVGFGHARLSDSPNVPNTYAFQRGDVNAGFERAALVVERRFDSQWFHQCYLEPQTAAARWDGDRVTIWSSTQGIFATRTEVAEALGLLPEQVLILPMVIGGGFGGKLGVVEALVAATARVVQRPLRLTYSRSEEFLCADPQGAGSIELRIGSDGDGHLTALKARTIFDTGTSISAASWLAPILVGGQYRFQNLDIQGYEVFTNRTGAGSFRAPAGPQTFFAVETLIDEIAEQLGIDALEFRKRNAVEAGDPRPHGIPWPPIALKTVLERTGEHALWRQRERFGGGKLDAWGRRLGVGLAVAGWQGAFEKAESVCRLETDGTVRLLVGAMDISGAHTSLVQMAAEGLGLDPEYFRIDTLPTDRAPYAGASGGSKITYSVGPAVYASAVDLREKLLHRAGRLLELSPDDLEANLPVIQVRGVPDRALTLAELAQAAEPDQLTGRGDASQSQPGPAFGAHIVQIGVNQDTGVVDVLRYVVVQDAGRAINPGEVEGQIHGGIAQGLGWALYEEIVHSSGGQVMTGSWLDYTLANASQIPEVEVHLLEVPSEHGPFGARPVGEPPVVPVAAAIANAIYDAIGVRLTRLPMTPERIFQAMRHSDGRA